MARITFTPVVASASGKTADAVFASWKGRNYIRRRVVPANPQTAAQDTVRESMARLPSLWRSLETQVKTAQQLYATPLAFSGWNLFAKYNRVLEQTYMAGKIMPPYIPIVGAVTLTLTDLTGGSLKIDWTGGTESAGHKLYCLIRKIAALPAATAYTIHTQDITLWSAHTLTKAALASCTLLVSISNELVATHKFSESKWTSIVMGA